jgi:hypothetical protein
MHTNTLFIIRPLHIRTSILYLFVSVHIIPTPYVLCTNQLLLGVTVSYLGLLKARELSIQISCRRQIDILNRTLPENEHVSETHIQVQKIRSPPIRSPTIHPSIQPSPLPNAVFG